MEKVQSFLDDFNVKTKDLPVVSTIAEKTGVPTGYLTLGFAFLVLICFLSGIGGHLICDGIAIIYPCYMSFKAIESRGEDDDKQWLTYWVVFAICRVLDDFSNYLFFWVPFYYPLKLVFLVYLFHPSTKGALHIYTTAIQPFLKMHESKIDKGIATATKAANDAANKAKQEAMSSGAQYIAEQYSKPHDN